MVVWTEPLKLPNRLVGVKPELVEELGLLAVVVVFAPTARTVAIPPVPSVAAVITPAAARRAVEIAGVLFMSCLPGFW